MLIWTDAVELNSGKFYFKRVQTDYERKNSTAMFCVSGIVTRLTICFDLTRKSAFPEPSLWSCMCSHHKFTAKAKYEIIFNVMRSNESQFCFPRCMLQLSWISFNDRDCSTSIYFDAAESLPITYFGRIDSHERKLIKELYRLDIDTNKASP